VDTRESSATTLPVEDTHGTPHGCYSGLVFIGHLIEEDGEEVEVIEAVPCRRCAGSSPEAAGVVR